MKQPTMHLFPAILTDQLSVAQSQLTKCQNHPDLSVVQIDVVDGYFADNLTVPVSELSQLSFGQAQIDLHLMTEEPMDAVYEAMEHAVDLPIRSVIGQIEHMTSQYTFVEQVKTMQWQAALSVDLFTPIEELDFELFHKLQAVQLMAIEAGFQQQIFSPLVFESITALQKLKKDAQADFEIWVDGGVNLDTLPSLVAAQIDGVAVGSALWRATDFSQAVSDLTSCMSNS